MEERLCQVEGETNAINEKNLPAGKSKDDQGALLARLKDALAALKAAICELKKKELFLYVAEGFFIERLHAQYQDITDPIIEGRLITPNAPLEHHTGIIGKVKEVQSVQNGEAWILQNLLLVTTSSSCMRSSARRNSSNSDPQQISKKIGGDPQWRSAT